MLAVGLLVALAVECHPGAQEEFDFMDGTRPNRQFSRNSFLPPVDITGARLDVHDRQFCGQSYVATGTVQVSSFGESELLLTTYLPSPHPNALKLPSLLPLLPGLSPCDEMSSLTPRRSSGNGKLRLL